MKDVKEYHKINTLFERDEKTKKLIYGKYRDEEVEFLSDKEWEFTEKIDGTNIRIHWDGHKVSYLGRTANSQLPQTLLTKLIELFGGEVNEQIFEQKFGKTEVVLIGEGYGEKIQNGGNYIKGNDFILFDVFINNIYLKREDVQDIANTFNLRLVPVVFDGTIEQAINYVRSKPDSLIGTAKSEGLIGRPKIELLKRNGDRIIVKVKVCDFE